jgi:transposase
MEAYPMRLRERIIQLYDQGKQTHEIAQMLGTCRSGTRRVKQALRERKTLKPRRGKTGPASGLTDKRAARLARAGRRRPGSSCATACNWTWTCARSAVGSGNWGWCSKKVAARR